MAERCRLHRSKLVDFLLWCRGQPGMKVDEDRNGWEVALIKWKTRKGNRKVTRIWDRLGGDHLVTDSEGVSLIQKWIARRDRSEAQE